MVLARFLGVVIVAAGGLASVALAADHALVAHWAFDEGGGDALHDQSGNENHGKIRGAKWVKTGEGFALEFDGVDDCVDGGAGPSLDLRDKVSIMLWAYPAAHVYGGDAGIAGKAYASYTVNRFKNFLYFYIYAAAHTRRAPRGAPARGTTWPRSMTATPYGST